MNTSDLTERLAFRVHINDKKLLMKLLADANLTMQEFGVACTDAYLRADPHIMKTIQDWKMLNEIPKDHLERYTLSHRERADLMKQLEEEEKKGK